MPFISSSCLIAVARTSSTKLIKIVKVDIFVLFLILKKMLLVFPIGCDVSFGFVIYGLHYIEICSLYSHFPEFFIINEC